MGNLVHGGFLPNGAHGLLLSLVVVMFSFGGPEPDRLDGGPGRRSRRSIPRAVNQVIWRILLFYVGALGVVLMTL